MSLFKVLLILVPWYRYRPVPVVTTSTSARTQTCISYVPYPTAGGDEWQCALVCTQAGCRPPASRKPRPASRCPSLPPRQTVRAPASAGCPSDGALRVGFGRIVASGKVAGCFSESGIKWMSSSATRQCYRALRARPRAISQDLLLGGMRTPPWDSCRVHGLVASPVEASCACVLKEHVNICVRHVP